MEESEKAISKGVMHKVFFLRKFKFNSFPSGDWN